VLRVGLRRHPVTVDARRTLEHGRGGLHSESYGRFSVTERCPRPQGAEARGKPDRPRFPLPVLFPAPPRRMTDRSAVYRVAPWRPPRLTFWAWRGSDARAQALRTARMRSLSRTTLPTVRSNSRRSS
jgi:hypothetical protein